MAIPRHGSTYFSLKPQTSDLEQLWLPPTSSDPPAKAWSRQERSSNLEPLPRILLWQYRDTVALIFPLNLKPRTSNSFGCLQPQVKRVSILVPFVL
jgi:hypothetical protein